METVQRGIAARSMAKIPAYADGGVVSPYSIRGIINKAKSMLEPEPVESMTAKFARQDAERAAKTPPVQSSPPEPAEKPNVIDKINARNKLLQGLKDGGEVKAGIIRGPGTGTSDSIKGKMKPGSFVMPKDSTDVMVSNGETNFTPEMVQKIGAAALMAAKGMTHTPAAEQSAAKFANGGVVDEEKKPMSYGDQMRNVGSAIMNAPIEAAKTLVSAPGYGINKDPAPVVAAASPTQSQVTPGVSPTGGISAPVTPAAPTSPVQPAVAALAEPSNQVTRVGNSYTGAPNISGDISINGSKGGGISPQNSQAAQALSDSSTARLASAPAAPETGGVNYGTGGSTYTQDLARKNAETGASSIFNTASRQTARDALKRMDTQDLAGINNQSTQAVAKLNADTNLTNARIGADTQRVGYGITAQNNLATQQNAAARLGIERTTAGLANQLTGQQIGASKQMQDLQTKLVNSKTPEERAINEENLRAAQGKYEKAVANRITVVPGAKNADGTQDAAYVINNETGEEIVRGVKKPAIQEGAISTVSGKSAKFTNGKWVPI